jgi:hypothetical protein
MKKRRVGDLAIRLWLVLYFCTAILYLDPPDEVDVGDKGQD